MAEALLAERRFAHDVAHVARALPPARPGSHVAVAFDRDHRALAATVFAAWSRGHGVLLPANARRAAVGAALQRPDVAALAHDTGAGLGIDVPRTLAGAAPGNECSGGRDFATTGTVTTLDGDAVHTRSGAELDALVAGALARLRLPHGGAVWSGFAAGAPCAFVPALLAPLRAGSRVLGGDLGALANERVHALVAPAAALRRLARTGATLPRDLAIAVAGDEAPDERTVTAFVRRRIDLFAHATLGPATDPRAAVLAARLLALDRVDDAAVVMVDGEHTRACCVAVTTHGESSLRRALGLGDDVAVRCVPEVPRDRDGRCERGPLLRLFDRLPDGRLATRTLDVERLPDDGATQRFRTRLPATFYAFDGHFAGYPVLSGAVQLHELVLPCLRAALGPATGAAAFADLKFLSRIAPDDEIEIRLAPDVARGAVDFEIVRGTTRCSAGRALLRRAEDPA